MAFSIFTFCVDPESVSTVFIIGWDREVFTLLLLACIAAAAAARRAFHGTAAPEAYRQKIMWQTKSIWPVRVLWAETHRWWVVLQEGGCSQSNRNVVSCSHRYTSKYPEDKIGCRSRPENIYQGCTWIWTVVCIWIQINVQIKPPLFSRVDAYQENNNHFSRLTSLIGSSYLLHFDFPHWFSATSSCLVTLWGQSHY